LISTASILYAKDMTDDEKKKRCPFDVLFDIIDEWQEKGKQSTAHKNTKDFENKKCHSCGEFVTREQIVCVNCGKKL
jgi:hypothetical protein